MWEIACIFAIAGIDRLKEAAKRNFKSLNLYEKIEMSLQKLHHYSENEDNCG